MRIGIDGRLLGYKQGVGRHVWELISGASRLVPENEYFVYVKTRGLQQVRGEGTVRPNVRIVQVDGAPFLLREQVAFARAVHRDRLDLLHVTFDHGLPLWAPDKVVLTIHDAWFERDSYFRSNWTRRYYHVMTRRGLRKAQCVLTVSNFVREKILKYCPWMRHRGAKLKVVPNGVGREFRPDVAARCSMLRTYGVERYILYVGLLAAHKNVLGILEGYGRLCQRFSDPPPLVMAGACHPPLAAAVEAARRRFGPKVIFLGHVPDEELPALYRGADLFVFPSFHEGFAIPIVEAMACGIPVITANVAAMPEVAGDAALLVDPANSESIQAAMAIVLSDAAVRQGLVARGLRRAQEFSWEKMARQVVEVYDAVRAGN